MADHTMIERIRAVDPTLTVAEIRRVIDFEKGATARRAEVDDGILNKIVERLGLDDVGSAMFERYVRWIGIEETALSADVGANTRFSAPCYALLMHSLNRPARTVTYFLDRLDDQSSFEIDHSVNPAQEVETAAPDEMVGWLKKADDSLCRLAARGLITASGGKRKFKFEDGADESYGAEWQAVRDRTGIGRETEFTDYQFSVETLEMLAECDRQRPTLKFEDPVLWDRVQRAVNALIYYESGESNVT